MSISGDDTRLVGREFQAGIPYNSNREEMFMEISFIVHKLVSLWDHMLAR